jgi:hypothetical protein
MNLLKKNQNKKERITRFVIGLVLCVPFFTHGYTVSYMLLGIGGILIFNAISGVCMIYKMFGYSTCKID